MGSAPAGAEGVRDALDILRRKGNLRVEEDLDVVVLAGDGGSNGIGLSATAGAIERSLNFYYVCYDNEGYANTGPADIAGDPAGGANGGGSGPPGRHHRQGGSLCDLDRPPAGLRRDRHGRGAGRFGAEGGDGAGPRRPKLFIAQSPCPTGWYFDPEQTMRVGKLAVSSGIWPLKEYVNGTVTHTKRPRARGARPPVEEYLKRQGRFGHLFRPTRRQNALDEIQQHVDAYWDAAP